MKFTCGHTQEEPRNMGRGAARQKRLIEFFNRKCLDCRLMAEAYFELDLSRPRSQEKREAAIERIRSSYR